MKKTMLALATVATMAVGTLAPTTADARCYGCAVGAGVAAGVIGGAIIGGAIANSQPRYYAPAPGYVVYEGYGAAYPAGCPGGYWARRPLRDVPTVTSSAGANRGLSALKDRVTNLGG
jgi:hypothetical protein